MRIEFVIKKVAAQIRLGDPAPTQSTANSPTGTGDCYVQAAGQDELETALFHQGMFDLLI